MKKSKPLLQRKKSTLDSKEDDAGKIDCMSQFKPDSKVFDDLTIKSNLNSDHPLVNVIITQNSKNCIAIATKSDEHFELQGYCLTNKVRVFTNVYRGKYIKMNLIE
jgi:hypothetical protein